MPLAWEATLSAKERKAFKVIYGEARAQEEIYEIMAELLLSSKAPGTITGYVAAIEKWVKFARRNGFGEFPPDRRHFALYIKNLSKNNTSYASFKLLSAAMPFYYQARDSDIRCVTKSPLIKLALDGAMRKAAKLRGPIKKAKTFDEESIKSVLREIFWPTGSQNYPNQSLKEWRTATRLYTYYMTLCRFDCYSKLRLSSFSFQQDHVVITYELRKNDQLYNGSTSVLKYRPNDSLCPKLVYQTYFRLMNFSAGASFLNCRLTFNARRSRPATKLSYAQSLKDSKDLLLCHGIDGVTEKSFKASGVTVLLDKKTSITDVQIFGGWKSEQTPLFYVSKEFTD